MIVGTPNIAKLKEQANRDPKDKVAKEQFEALIYIEKLAAMTSTKIDGWNIIETFGVSADTLSVTTDRGEINKRFFAKREAQPVVQPLVTTKFTLPQEMLAKIDKVYSDRVAQRKREVEERLILHKRNADTHNNRLHESLLQIRETQRQIDEIGLADDKADFTQEVEAVCNSSFWELWDCTTQSIEWVSRGDLLLEQVNKSAKIDIKVNLGRVRVRLSPNTLDLRVLPHWNNLHDSRRFHPHVYGDGRICWGSAEGEYHELLPKLKISKIMDTLANLLSKYNPDSPINSLGHYVSAKSFNSDKEPVSPMQLRAENKMVMVTKYTCNNCELSEHDCSCDTDEFNEVEEWVTAEEQEIYE
jgi:hypothetical protein